MSKTEIDEMEYIEYTEAIDYVSKTYQLRSMGTTEGKKPTGDHHTFEQPDDFDLDPNFTSDLNYKGP